jgi:hypothetical protein
MRAREITSGEIRDIIVMDSLTKIIAFMEYGPENKFALEDSFSSIMFLGPPGVGKSSLQYLGIKDVAGILSEKRGKEVTAVKVSLRITHEEASRLAERVVKGEVIPYVHLYLPQMKPWHLEGTPSPVDNFVEVAGKKIPYNLWRLDPFMIPLLDYTDIVKSPDQIVTPLLVIDEFNMGRKDVREALFQLARSAELGKAKLNPLSIITLIGNTPESNIYAEEELPAPLVNRASRYIVSKPTLDGWLAFMNEVYGKKWFQEVGGFLLINRKYLYMKDQVDKEIVITPRTWTQLSIKLYTLKLALTKRYGFLDSKDKFWKHAERIIYGYLTQDVASEFYGFLRGLSSVNFADIIRDPSKLEKLDRNLVAYLLVKITSSQMEVYRRNKEKRDEILKKLVEMYEHGRKKIGNEALGIIISSLPEPVRIKFASLLPSSVRGEIREITKKVREYEELLTA